MLRNGIFWLCLLAPMLLVILVNESHPDMSHEYLPDQCSRYCHDHACPHADLSPRQQQLYAANLSWLTNNPFGLSYQAVNLLIYVLLLPFLILFFLWTLLRKRHGPTLR